MLFSFCAKDDVASATTAAHQDVNCRRHVNRQGNRKVDHPSRLQVQASNSFLLTRGDNTHPSTPSKNRLALVFVASSVHGMGLVMTRSVSEAISHRETKSRRNAKSHEGYNHKRVCITGSNRNHRTFVCAGPYWQPTSYGCGGKRILAVGTNSMWRCCEWDQWLWPPHDQNPTPIAQQPQRVTFRRGPHIMSKARELSFDEEEGERGIKQ